MLNHTSLYYITIHLITLHYIVLYYRYGVYPEIGFPGDPLYPLQSPVEATNNTVCGHNTLLCDITTHYDRRARTKQNLLCGGRSVKEVIMDSQDFKEVEEEEEEEGGRKVWRLVAAPRDPVVSYTRPGPSQYVLLLDQDQPAHRWTHVKRALYQFIELIPEGSVLSIISMSDTAVVLLPPTTVQDTHREGLQGRIPRRGSEDSSTCVLCGVQLGLDTLGDLGGNLVLISGHNMDKVLLPEELESLFLISYRGEDDLLERVPHPVTVYSVIERGGKENTLNALTEAFIDIVNTVEVDTQVEKVFESSHLAYEFSSTFFIEENQRTDITINLNIDDEQKIESFEVKDPSGQKNIFSKFGDGVVVFRLPGISKSGIWTFNARLYSEAVLPSERMSVTVLARGDGVRAKADSKKNILVTGVSSDGGRSVVGVSVTAQVTSPGGHTKQVILHDSGLGYPDITHGDGLYTGFISGFSNMTGYHTVRLRLEEGGGGAVILGEEEHDTENTDCCGSRRELEPAEGAATGQFLRFLTAPSIFLEAGSGEDTIPPSRIPDLTLSHIETNSSSILLTWTAPGGDMDQGRAEYYEVRYNTDPDILMANFSVCEMVDMGEAGQYGDMETLQARVPYLGQTFYYGVVAVDGVGNIGEVSNLVEVFIHHISTTQAPLPLTQEGEEMLPDLATTSLGHTSWLLDRDSMVLVGGVVGGVILVVVSLVIGLLLRAKKKSRGPDKGETGGVDTYEAGFYPDIKISASVATSSGAREVYDWLEGSQGSTGSRPETAASTEESTASNGEEEQESHSEDRRDRVLGERHSQSQYSPTTDLAAGQYRQHSYIGQSIMREGGLGGSTRHYRPRVGGGEQGVGAAMVPGVGQHRKRRHESVV